MAALLRVVGPAMARYFDPGPDDLIDTFFDGVPMPVTVEVFPFNPATRITSQKLSINGSTQEFSDVSGQNPVALQFHLGGNTEETAGGINTANLTVTDDAGAITNFSLRYFRMVTTANTNPTTTTTSLRLTTSPPEPLP